MGRKKRPAATHVGNEEPAAPPPFPHTATFDAYGRPLPPPMPPPDHQDKDADDEAAPPPKRSRDNNGEEESYLVKKYRPDSYYRSIEAFSKYTKSHRMFDASYVRWTEGGETPEKPHVFGIRIAGTFLSWGRGKTRDAAIDASIRAAFALVAAHGYDDFTLTDDCFTEEPVASDLMAPIPPPPPPPPPLPPGALPPLPPGMPPPHSTDVLIPQPAAPKAELAVASAVGGGGGLSTGVASGSNPGKPITLGMPSSVAGTTALPPADASKKKGDNKLVFSGEEADESGEELSMEEVRMRVPRYWNLVMRALTKRNEALLVSEEKQNQ
eukprot:CCRYP_010971-RA/>CCRYP_010971-RA protein AED:0.41 eAED:0.41 QI:67/0.5/0.33/1/0.5/0.33/3/0/324